MVWRKDGIEYGRKARERGWNGEKERGGKGEGERVGDRQRRGRGRCRGRRGCHNKAASGA